MKIVKKVLCLLFCAVFAIFSYLQLNDGIQYGNSDAWVWISIYGTMSVLSGLVAWGKVSPYVLSLWVGFAWGCLLFRIQDAHGNLHFAWLHMSSYWNPVSNEMIQENNESGGLFILACWSTLLFLLDRKAKP